MRGHVGSLLDYLGRDVPAEVRILKLAEETGEAAQALRRGRRPRGRGETGRPAWEWGGPRWYPVCPNHAEQVDDRDDHSAMIPAEKAKHLRWPGSMGSDARLLCCVKRDRSRLP
jgi:hypothetical protein